MEWIYHLPSMEWKYQHNTQTLKFKGFLFTFPNWGVYEMTLVLPFHSGHVFFHSIEDQSRGMQQQQQQQQKQQTTNNKQQQTNNNKQQQQQQQQQHQQQTTDNL